MAVGPDLFEAKPIEIMGGLQIVLQGEVIILEFGGEFPCFAKAIQIKFAHEIMDIEVAAAGEFLISIFKRAKFLDPKVGEGVMEKSGPHLIEVLEGDGFELPVLDPAFVFADEIDDLENIVLDGLVGHHQLEVIGIEEGNPFFANFVHGKKKQKGRVSSLREGGRLGRPLGFLVKLGFRHRRLQSGSHSDNGEGVFPSASLL